MILKLPEDWLLGGDSIVAGVDIGGTQCSVNLAQVEGREFRLLAQQQFPTMVSRGPEAIISEIEDRLKSIIDRGAKPAVVGVSCGGPLEATTGVVQSPPNLPGWDDIPITSMLERAIGAPCALANDANACALAEWAFGSGREARNLVYLTFGTGLGAGVILDGVPYAGAGGLAGEVGHWRLGPDSGPSNYGKRGSFQGFCSGKGVVDWYRHWGGAASDQDLSARSLAARARDGDGVALRVFDQAAEMLGHGIALLVDALAPEVVVVGGIFTYAPDLLEQRTRASMDEEALPQLARNCRVVPAGLGEELGSYSSCCVAVLHAGNMSGAGLSRSAETDAG